jgi:hypothetical protein
MNILNKISEWLGSAKRVVYTLEEEQLQFACYVGQGCFTGMVEVVVYEYRPYKKFFKEKYFGSKSFWLDDFNTIEGGVLTKLSELCLEEAHELGMQEKWKEFEKTIDKTIKM